jgi:polyferredoxin
LTDKEATVVKVKQLPKRQRVRIALLYVSLLIFPITLYYFSPYIIVDAATNGIINASFVVFFLMFISALFIGRSWCAWLCPAGALQEMGNSINKKPAPGGRWNWIKWGIWLPWVVIIAVLAAQAGGYHTLDPFYQMDSGVTLAQPFWYMIYYIIIALCLLDGPFYDPRSPDSQPFQLASTTAKSGALQVHGMPDLHTRVSHEPGGAPDGARGTDGTR